MGFNVRINLAILATFALIFAAAFSVGEAAFQYRQAAALREPNADPSVGPRVMAQKQLENFQSP
jgi:hypothetical protein